jgi:demethylmenaquinone methyltransferase / 2-methoxy-6-polyprenyl-1,4-benzoquinol methylase
MANEFYQPGEARAARVNELFTRIASRYDLINDLQSFGLHRWWKGRLIRLAQPAPGETALDLCCGTGDLARRLARRGARVSALDFNQGMLDVARNRPWQAFAAGCGTKDGGPAHIAVSPRFIQGDALRLPFPDQFFDIVTVAYGLRNLPDVRAGLAEMCRVAAPGARLLVLDFGKPDNAVWRALYYAYLRCIVPVLGWLFCGSASAYAYILESLKHYPAQRGVAQTMRELGLVNVRIINLLGGVMSINYGETACP